MSELRDLGRHHKANGRSAPRTVRMLDVAKLAGVGTMTVSRVLNGTARVSEETSNRVHQAIQQLQYKPNQMARALRGSRSHTIGVLLPYLYDPFFASCAHAISEVAQSHNYSVILTTTNEHPGTELEAVRQMSRRQVDGLIVIPAEGSGSMLTAAEFLDLPIVTLDRPVPRSNFDTVQAENKRAGELATEHLISHGHERIAFIALGRKLFTMKTRFAGYQAAMQRAKLIPEAYFDCKPQEVVTKLLGEVWSKRDRPTAIFTANGLTTRYALQALTDLRLEIPRDVAVIGFDDVDFADLMRPALTVVRQPVLELGRTAAELLFERLDPTQSVGLQRSLVLPVELVLRSSCGCLGYTAEASGRR